MNTLQRKAAQIVPVQVVAHFNRVYFLPTYKHAKYMIIAKAWKTIMKFLLVHGTVICDHTIDANSM